MSVNTRLHVCDVMMLCYIMTLRHDAIVIKISDSYCSTGQFLKAGREDEQKYKI